MPHPDRSARFLPLSLLATAIGCGAHSDASQASWSLPSTDSGAGGEAPNGDARNDAGPMDGPLHSSPNVAAVYTQHNDVARTGANLAERTLSTTNVHKETFGLLYSRPVVGQIYAQPLYAPRVPIGKDVHDVVVVATEHDDVYAFDAVDSLVGPLWHVHLAEPVPTIDLLASGYCRDLSPEIGITATPAIDPVTNLVYVETKEKADDGSYAHRLHALDLATGEERANGPVQITAEIPVNGDGSSDATLAFDALRENGRAAVLLSNGVVWLAYGAHCDTMPYYGWVIAYDAATLRQLGVFVTTPNGGTGGIWMSGQGLAADDSGDVYFVSGQGTYDDTTTPMEVGDSFGRLHLGDEGIALVDWFTPYDQADLEIADIDLGSTGAVLVPGTQWVIGAGKEGKLYVVDRNDMGRYNDTDDSQIIESFQATEALPEYGHPLFGSPVHWNGRIYLWGGNDALRAFRIINDQIDAVPEGVSTVSAPTQGGILSISANGAFGDSAIVWASHAKILDGISMPGGVLRAFAATDVTQEIWNSEQVPERDAVGTFAKFSPPTIADGHVFLATFDDKLQVYGLLDERVVAAGGAPKAISP